MFIKKNKNILLLSTLLLTLTACKEEPVNNNPTHVHQSSTAENTTNLVAKAVHLAPYGKRPITDEVFYFVLPDRFANGDKSNDLGADANDKKRALSHGGFDKTNKGMFHGGDIKGLTAKLDYLDNMGITAIWLTPVLRNMAVQADSAGYHGYWILDFSELDPHFGSNQDLKDFINKAHQRNIKVFFDIITNHTADVIKYKECHGEDGLGWIVDGNACPYKSLADMAKGDKYSPIIPQGNEKLKTPAWLNDVNYYHNQGDSTWQGESVLNGDFSGLDDIKTENPVVVNGMIAIYKKLIDEFKPDGYRIDTVKHVNIEFWQKFAPALIAHAKEVGIENFFMFGEVYSSDASYLSQYTTTGKMQSVLDFALQAVLVETIVEQQGTDKLAQLFNQDHLYQDPLHQNQNSTANELINFISNHDMGRFAHRLATSKFNYNEQQQIARLNLASAMMFFARGVPVIYYGDEQGFVGDGGDRDARQDMMPSLVASYNDDDLLATDKTTADDNFDVNHPLYQTFSHYAALYQQYPSLRNGKQNILYSQNKAGIFALTKTLADEKLLIIFNTSDTPQKFTLAGTHFNAIYGDANARTYNSETQFTLAPLSFAIYQKLTF